jgi:hypothetical protein
MSLRGTGNRCMNIPTCSLLYVYIHRIYHAYIQVGIGQEVMSHNVTFPVLLYHTSSFSVEVRDCYKKAFISFSTHDKRTLWRHARFLFRSIRSQESRDYEWTHDWSLKGAWYEAPFQDFGFHAGMPRCMNDFHQPSFLRDESRTSCKKRKNRGQLSS